MGELLPIDHRPRMWLDLVLIVLGIAVLAATLWLMVGTRVIDEIQRSAPSSHSSWR